MDRRDFVRLAGLGLDCDPAIRQVAPCAHASAQAHIDAVSRAVGLIHRGDMFQANITLRLDADFTGDPLDLFCQAAGPLAPPATLADDWLPLT